MILWRISNHATLDGQGGLKASGRWHTRGQPVVYCAPSPAAALLEILVHLEIDVADLPTRYRLLRIEAAQEVSVERLAPEALAESWREDLAVTRRLGDAWLGSGRSALLEVPSALVPETWNVLLNPAHPDHSRIRITTVSEHVLDPRLL